VPSGISAPSPAVIVIRVDACLPFGAAADADVHALIVAFGTVTRVGRLRPAAFA
jgi:hypothetical protein